MLFIVVPGLILRLLFYYGALGVTQVGGRCGVFRFLLDNRDFLLTA